MKNQLFSIPSGFIRIGSISSIATHCLPNIIAQFQKQYPNIEYEILLGHYADVERWLCEGRVDCGFTRVPTRLEFDTVFLEKDRLLAVLPEDNFYSTEDKFPISALSEFPFILLEKNEKADISEFLDSNNIRPNVRFTTIDDYAVMSMVEKGLGIGIMPELILKRTPYNIVTKELDVPAFRDLGFAVNDKKTVSLAVKKFTEYLKYRT